MMSNSNYSIGLQCVTLTFAERFRLVFSLSGFANLSTKVTTKRRAGVQIKFKCSAERKHLAIRLSES